MSHLTKTQDPALEKENRAELARSWRLRFTHCNAASKNSDQVLVAERASLNPGKTESPGKTL
jgi:hypothetical protein